MNPWTLNDAVEAKTMKRVESIYSAALKTALKRQKAFLKKVKDVDSGKIKPPQYYIDRNEVDKWRQGFLTEAARQAKIVDGIIEDMKAAGEMAGGAIEDSMQDIYRNQFGEQAQIIIEESEQLGISPSFTMYNKAQLGVLLKKNQSPFSKVAYNNLGSNAAIRKGLQNALAQSIILGESQDKMTKRIRDIAGYKAMWQAVRTAQTERTRVQAEATHDVAKQAAEQGIVTFKQWSAKMINSRDTHRALNGVCAYTEEPFESPSGAKLMYPADPSAPAAEVCNCHCVYIEHVLLDGEEIIDGKVVKTGTGEVVADFDKILWKNHKKYDPSIPDEEESRQRVLDRINGKNKQNVPSPVPVPAVNATGWAWLDTIDKANEFLKNHGCTSMASLSKQMSLEDANEICKTIAELQDKYPIPTLQSVLSKELKTDVVMQANASKIEISNAYDGKLYASSGKKNFVIIKQRNINDIKNYETMLANGTIPWYETSKSIKAKLTKLKNRIKFNCWTIDEMLPDEKYTAATVAHEYGHSVADLYFGQINGYYYRAKKDPKTGKAFNAQKQQDICTLIEQTYAEAKKSGDIYDLSEYGAKNVYEFFAESFAAYHTGKQLPDEICKMMEHCLDFSNIE